MMSRVTKDPRYVFKGYHVVPINHSQTLLRSLPSSLLVSICWYSLKIPIFLFSVYSQLYVFFFGL